MKNEITLFNSPFFENLVSVFNRINRYKRIFTIKAKERFSKILFQEEKIILTGLTPKGRKIILEILISNKLADLPAENNGKEIYYKRTKA